MQRPAENGGGCSYGGAYIGEGSGGSDGSDGSDGHLGLVTAAWLATTGRATPGNF